MNTTKSKLNADKLQDDEHTRTEKPKDELLERLQAQLLHEKQMKRMRHGECTDIGYEDLD